MKAPRFLGRHGNNHVMPHAVGPSCRNALPTPPDDPFTGLTDCANRYHVASSCAHGLSARPCLERPKETMPSEEIGRNRIRGLSEEVFCQGLFNPTRSLDEFSGRSLMNQRDPKGLSG